MSRLRDPFFLLFVLSITIIGVVVFLAALSWYLA